MSARPFPLLFATKQTTPANPALLHWIHIQSVILNMFFFCDERANRDTNSDSVLVRRKCPYTRTHMCVSESHVVIYLIWVYRVENDDGTRTGELSLSVCVYVCVQMQEPGSPGWLSAHNSCLGFLSGRGTALSKSSLITCADFWTFQNDHINVAYSWLYLIEIISLQPVVPLCVITTLHGLYRSPG